MNIQSTSLKLRCTVFNPLALELDIYSLAHHLYNMLIFYEPRRVTLGYTRHFVRQMVRESLKKIIKYIC